MCIRRISTATAARLLDKCEDYVRWGLQQGRLPFGTAVQTAPKRWSYHISPKLLADYTGLSVDEILRTCSQENEAQKKMTSPEATGKAKA